MSKILLTLTHLPQSYKTYNSAHVPDTLSEKPTHTYTTEPIRCYLLHRTFHTIQGICIHFILYLIYIMKHSIFYDFNKQMLIYLQDKIHMDEE